MHSPCGRFALVFNGEVYNHSALRSRLEKDGLGCSWRGHSDTETLLAGFCAWGIERTLQSAQGMFALALWDKQAQTLFLARDRMGEKPLYWGWQNGTLLFGSELKALKAHPAFSAQINRNALALLLRYNYIPAPYSIYTGIQKLAQGHYVGIRAGQSPESVHSRPYWLLSAAARAGSSRPFQGTDAEAVDALDAQLSASVGRQMVADVPLGAFLSGGIDSSVIVALMQKQSSTPVRTFTIGFQEPGFNEAEHAKAVATHLGTDHTELYVTGADALAVVPTLASVYCEPFADSSQIPTCLLSQLARRNVTVALSGDGGDELFGGYTPYQFAPAIWKRLSHIPQSLRRMTGTALAPFQLPPKIEKLMSVLPSRDRADFFMRLRSHWLEPDAVVMGSTEPASLLGMPDEWNFLHRLEDWMMAMDTQGYMADDILVKVDRAAMANSLETRVPMLDHHVVELAWRLPLHLKIREGQGKWILRQLLYRHVPQAMVDRPKKGFMVPLGAWLRGPLRSWAESLLDATRLRNEGYFNVDIVRRTWLEHSKGTRDHSLRLWSILMFQAWLVEQ